MKDFQFLQNSFNKKWVILDPGRSKRPNVGHKTERLCPFCIGREQEEQEVYRIGGERGDSNWHIRVIKNKFPFASIHEIVVHSPDHHKNFDELPLSHIGLIIQTYRERYLQHSTEGQVYIFHNRGIGGGESIPHPHTQLTVIPKNITLDLCPLDNSIYSSGWFFRKKDREDVITTSYFYIYCPSFSQWPDETWIVPVKKNTRFGDVSDKEIEDLAFCINRLINIFELRLGHEFPFNFYIYPGRNWYIRLFPRIKILGGFEMGTGIVVNTQDPKDTFAFIKTNFFEPDLEKLQIEQQEDYWKCV